MFGRLCVLGLTGLLQAAPALATAACEAAMLSDGHCLQHVCDTLQGIECSVCVCGHVL